jgi:hypothetical protein
MRIALIQTPAWGALPPLGPSALKAYATEHGYTARCFDFNIEYYNQHQREKAKIEESGRSYGGADPWGADSYGQWAMDYDRWQEDIHFQPGSKYNDTPLPIDRWADAVLAWEPRIVGFTTYLTSLPTSLLLARELKRRDPSIVTVFGGPNSASDREGHITLLTGIPDAVVHGEGEATLLAIAESVIRGEDLGGVPGVGTLVGGEVVWAPVRPLIKKIDTLPFPDFSDFDLLAYPNPYLIPIMASRGCVLHCAFCYETVYWKRFRMQSAERVVAEIEHQIANHPLRERAAAGESTFYFMFADSLVNGHLAGLKRFCQTLLDRNIVIRWGGQARMDKRMDQELCQLLADSGCTGLAFGLESGSQRVLESMGKHYSIEDAEGLIRRFHKTGMSATINVMVGFPTERLRDFLDTVLFLTKVRKWVYQVSNVTSTQVALGSDLYLHPEKYGVTIHPDNSWESPETGDEAARQRRTRFLHRWMALWRIPHQGIADD